MLATCNKSFVQPCLYALPEHHHVHGVVREAGDERSHRDDGDDGDEKMRAAVGTRGRSSVTLTPGDAPAVGVELKQKTTGVILCVYTSLTVCPPLSVCRLV